MVDMVDYEEVRLEEEMFEHGQQGLKDLDDKKVGFALVAAVVAFVVAKGEG